MKRILATILAVLTVMCLAGCNISPADDGTVKIVATAFPHYDFARQLTQGASNVEITMLISPGNEVHTYEPSPSDILAISTCDMFIYTGGESDTWVKNIIESSGNKDMKIVSFMEICGEDGHGEAHTDHDHEYDEHVWTLPLFSKDICKAIAENLCEIDKSNCEKYDSNLTSYLSTLDELDEEFSGIFTEKTREGIVVADRFPFTHFASHYNLSYTAAYPGCSSSTEPSASTIALLSNKVKSENIPYVFTIEFSNGKIAKSIIEGTDAKILTLHS